MGVQSPDHMLTTNSSYHTNLPDSRFRYRRACLREEWAMLIGAEDTMGRTVGSFDPKKMCHAAMQLVRAIQLVRATHGASHPTSVSGACEGSPLCTEQRGQEETIKFSPPDDPGVSVGVFSNGYGDEPEEQHACGC